MGSKLVYRSDIISLTIFFIKHCRVESRFKVLPHLLFIFQSPGRSRIYTMHKITLFLVFLHLGFYVHFVDENSVPTWSLYPSLDFTLNLRAILWQTLFHMLMFAQGQLPCYWLANNTCECSLTFSNWQGIHIFTSFLGNATVISEFWIW
jgi:hypothetical protein